MKNTHPIIFLNHHGKKQKKMFSTWQTTSDQWSFSYKLLVSIQVSYLYLHCIVFALGLFLVQK